MSSHHARAVQFILLKVIPRASCLFAQTQATVDESLALSGKEVSSLECQELGEAVGRRTRNLITLAPILEIERSKSQRDLNLTRHDLRMLCLVVLDVVIDKMGFGTGAARRDIHNALSPIVRSAEPTVSIDTEEQIIDLVPGVWFKDN